MSTQGVETPAEATSRIFRALQESEARFRSMADGVAAPVWVTTKAGGIEFVNRAFESIAGLPQEDLLGDTWTSLIHPDDLAEVAALRAAARETSSPYTFEARFRRADGAWRWLHCSSNPRFDAEGEFLGYVGLAVDLTDLLQAQSALRESEERFRLMSESAPVMLWMGDVDGKCLHLNKAQREFWGVAPDAVSSFDWSTTLHPDWVETVAGPFSEGMRDHKEFTVEAIYRRADGAWRRLQTHAQPRFDPSGAFLGMIGVNVDVTETRQAESDLQRINDLLSERVASALAEKENAETALFHAQKMEAVGRLTGGVAHDFNNLLTVVIGSLDMAVGKLEDPAKVRRLLEAAMEAARRGERLTHQLLSFSRRQALRPSLCDINSLVAASHGLLSRAVGESIRLDMRLAASPCTSWVDQSQLEAAVLNLVVNARDATPPGGAITIEVGRVVMAEGEVEGVHAGAYVRLVVADTGGGMSAEVLERVFEPFFTTKDIGRGTGLGLSQVYGFIAQSGGGIALHSRLGDGTRVELFLPLSHESPPEDGSPAVVSPEADQNLRILLVEDDPAVAAIAKDMLVSLGHAVKACANGEDALRQLHQDPPYDLMITDLIMPGGVSGIELARKAAHRDPDLCILLMSGYVGDGASEAFVQYDWPLLQKPYSRSDMAAALANFTPRQRLEPASE